jgi:hypothetical protein
MQVRTGALRGRAAHGAPAGGSTSAGWSVGSRARASVWLQPSGMRKLQDVPAFVTRPS